MKLRRFTLIFGAAFLLTITGFGALKRDAPDVDRSFDAQAALAVATEAEKNWPDNIEQYYREYYKLFEKIDCHQAVRTNFPVLQTLTRPLLNKSDAVAKNFYGSNQLLLVQSRGLWALLYAAKAPGVSVHDRLGAAERAIDFIAGLTKRVIPNYVPKEADSDMQVWNRNIDLNGEQMNLPDILEKSAKVLTEFLKFTAKEEPALKGQIDPLLQHVKEIQSSNPKSGN